MNRPTRAECIRRAAEIFAEGDLAVEQMTPREQAEQAWTPTSRYTVDELEDRIRVGRGLQPRHAPTAERPEG